MIFHETNLPGVFLINSTGKADSRGCLYRTFCIEEFSKKGLNTDWKQCSLVRTLAEGTVRGMHYQIPPYAEIKLIRCIRGAVWDILINIDRGSRSFGQWQSFVLSEQKPLQLYVPEGYAHGFQALEDDTELYYMISAMYSPDFARGVSYKDPDLNLNWPLPISEVSTKDNEWGRLKDVEHPGHFFK